jgi:hypothetical protein
MRPNKKTIFFTAFLCWAFSSLYAQKETEVFIPLGKSPGVSNKYSVIGKVETVNINDSIITIAQDANIKTCKINSRTEVYIDKSKLKLTNTKGSFADIKKGQMVEAKYKDNKPSDVIEWLKVKIE